VPRPPRPPQRPGQVITAAVLAFVQAGVAMVASLYIWMFASIADLALSQTPQGYAPARLDALAYEGTVLAVIGLVTAVLLIAVGVWALNSRSPGAWRLLIAAHAIQVVLALYWTVRLLALADEAPGSGSGGAIAGVSLFFLAGPLTALGLLLVGGGRRWFTEGRPAGA
jgi:hypothetical protein